MKNHKSRMHIEKKGIKMRRAWGFNPSTKVEQSTKKYNRSRIKREWRECE